MTRLRTTLTVAVFLCARCGSLWAEEQTDWVIEKLTPESVLRYDFATGLAVAENGVLVKHNGAVLTADTASINRQTSEVVASGHVRVQRNDQVWVSEHLRYNFTNHVAESQQ
jgi:lipopolysaccharide assembly outer membrane protein LptD (OstA)